MLSLLALFALSPFAAAVVPLSPAPCPPLLKEADKFAAAGTTAHLCELHARYSLAIQSAKARGIKEPSRIAELLAPRFLAPADWSREKVKASPDPKNVYAPGPATWNNWVKAVGAAEKRQAGISGAPPPREIDLTHLHSLFRLAISHDRYPFGWRKSTVEIGRAWEKSEAMPESQIAEARVIEYPVVDGSGKSTDQKLVRWVGTQCLEQRPLAFREKFIQDSERYSRLEHWPADESGKFTDIAGVSRQCGYLIYVNSALVPAQMKKWEADINGPLRAWREDQRPFDPIRLAARAQRWLVAIHPFPAGNGRVSRLVMDEILFGAGLPPPILKNMDDDFGLSEAAWAEEVAAGIVRYVETLEACAKEPTKKGCAIVR